MIKNSLKKIFHPFLIYAIIFFLECIPINKPRVYNSMPRNGENFKTANSDSVFYFSNGSSFFYESQECYFKFGNLPFHKTYEEGGVKVVTDKIAHSIPVKGSMCGEKQIAVVKVKRHSFFEKYINFGYVFMHFSAISHFLFYAIFAISFLVTYNSYKHKYWLAFFGCFVGGGVLEIIQHFFIEGRSASFEDQILNSTGALFGIISYKIIQKLCCNRK